MSIFSPIIFSIVHKGDSRFFWSKEVQIFKKMWGQRSKDRCFLRSKVKRSLIFVCWSVWLEVRRGKGKYWRSVVPALIGILIFSSYCCFMGDPRKHPHTMVKICMTTVWEDIRIISDKWNGGKYFWNRPYDFVTLHYSVSTLVASQIKSKVYSMVVYNMDRAS